MEESLLQSPRLAPIKRAQKIRERMLIERLSGVSAANKTVFLSLCLTHEGKYPGAGLPPENGMWQEFRRSETWENWEEWADWARFMQ